MLNITKDKGIVRESQKEQINEIKIDDEKDADPEAQNLMSINKTMAALKTMC